MLITSPSMSEAGVIVRWFLRVCVTILVVAGLIVPWLYKASSNWLNGHLNQVSLNITAIALLVAAYAAEQARLTVIQATRFRDIDRLEQIRSRVEGLIPAQNSITLSAELSRFGRRDLPKSWKLDDALPVAEGTSLDSQLVRDAHDELTQKLESLRSKVP